MKNYKKTLYIMIIILFSCNHNKKTEKGNAFQENNTVADGLKTVLNDYIIASPLKSNRIVGKSSIESGFSYPSYHLFFKEKNLDTIFSIVQFPSFNNFELESHQLNNEVDTIYHMIEPKGWIMYKGKYPLIIFDAKDYSSKLIKSNNLISKIPDSLKAGNNNQHVKFIKWDYKIKDRKFEKIDLLDKIHTHPEK